MVRIGVIGCGYWGPNLVRNFMAVPNCTMSMVCDIDEKRLEHMKKLYPEIEIISEFDTMVKSPDIDAVAIATPVRFHFEIAKQCLEAGKHILVEKPLASSLKECHQLRELAEQKKLVLMVGHTYLYSLPVKRIKDIIDSGDLGELHYIAARRLNLGLFQKDINVTWDLAPHDVSIILFVVEEEPVSVNCQGKAHINPGIEDITNMTISFANGKIATVYSSWLDPNKVRDITFVGSKRMLLYNDLESMEKIKIYDKRVETPPHYDTFAEFNYAYHYGDVYSPYVQQTEPLKEETQHFIDCIRTGDNPKTCGRHASKVVQVLEAASLSLRNGGGKVAVNGAYIS